MRLHAAAPLAVLLAPLAVSAGDCFEHPVTLLDVEVVSCAPLDAANAMQVVYLSSDKASMDRAITRIVSEHAAVILDVKVKRTRVIHVDGAVGWGQPPVAEKWIDAKAERRWLAYRTLDAAVCKRLTPKSRPVLAHPTSCECDTGPHGWCAVKADALITEVWKNLAEFTK